MLGVVSTINVFRILWGFFKSISLNCLSSAKLQRWIGT